MSKSEVLSTQDMLYQELQEVVTRRGRRSGVTTDHALDQSKTYEQVAKDLKLSALCMSGGGIRSAAFCLGVLQALAKQRLLDQFDYLSTVSGGGFIGGWLQILIRELGGIGSVEDAIVQPRPAALRRLRAFTNYLTPQTGPFSSDTWAGAVIYLRNLLINWAVFAPLFLLLALIPIGYRTAIWTFSDFTWVNVAVLVGAGSALLGGISRACSLLPSHREHRPPSGLTPAYASTESIEWSVVFPAFSWIFLIPCLAEFAIVRGHPWLAHDANWIVPLVYLVVMIMGYCLAWWFQSYRTDPGFRLFRANFVRWVTASIGSALLTWLLLNVAISVLSHRPKPLLDTALVLTVFAPLGLAVVHVLQTALYVALRRETELADLDREWLGRVNAMILRPAVGWVILAFCCLIITVLIPLVEPGAIATWSGGRISVVGAITALIGGVTAWLGKIWPSIQTFVDKPAVWDRVKAYLPAILCILFAACLLIVCGGVLQSVLAHLQIIVGNGPVKEQSRWLPLALQVIVAATLFLGVTTFQHVNVNRFSMHAVYRNRLVRAFLGSARNTREPDPFTGFDPDDNAPFSSLRETAGSLFPVINATLNITAGSNTAWAERKAASFVATPLACGSGALRHPTQPPAEMEPAGAFVPTTCFAGQETLKKTPVQAEDSGIRFGSILTVSGAAVSPNWGYHSSRVTSFVMTLFNMRLGVWLPNPSTSTAEELRLAQPRNSLLALVNEMLGQTTDDSQAIYLSDGGHFENLGLYEMLRRRCSSIVVIDAGADEACTLADLGNALRKAEIDFGITVAMQGPMHLYSRSHLEADQQLVDCARGFALGDIHYGGGHTGRLLYIKPSFLSNIPADVHSYGAEHTAFPQESTLDQWFTESQFESYRKLGEYQMQELVNKGPGHDRLDWLGGPPLGSQEPPLAARPVSAPAK